MSSTVARLGLQVWIVLFIVFFGAEVVHLEPRLRIVAQLLYGVPLAAWAAWRLRGARDLLDWMVLAALGLYAVVCLLSRDRTESLGTLALASALAAWFLLMRREASSSLRPTIVVAAATGLVLTLAFNAFLLVQEKLAWFAAYGSAPFEGLTTFPWESVNALPVLVLLAIPFLAWLPASSARTTGTVIVAASAVVVVPISLGRAGWLGLGVAATLIVGHRLLPRLGPSMRRGTLAGGLVLAAAAVIVVTPRVVDGLAESGRLLLWDQGLAMVASSPLAGAGPGTYSWARLDYAPATADLLAVRLLHNAYLQTLVDGGVLVVGGVLGVGVAAGVVAARRVSWSRADVVAAAGLVGYLAALTLDDFSYLPAVTALAATILAFLLPIAGEEATRRWFLPAALAGLAILGMPSVLAVDNARLAAQDGRSAMVDGRNADAVGAFTRATDAHPENGGYWLGLGMAADAAGDGELAVRGYQRATIVSPGDPRGYGGLAALAEASTAREWLIEAARRTLGDPRWDLRLGSDQLTAGATDDATQALARAVALRPSTLALVAQMTGADLEAVAEEAIRALAADLRPSSQQTAEGIWDLQLALDKLASDAGLAWLAVDAARNGDLAEAELLADRAVSQAPHEARGYQARAAVAAFACDDSAARAALALEAGAVGAHAEPAGEPAIRREFVYREASLGPTQPLAERLPLGTEIWPWPFVDRPPCP